MLDALCLWHDTTPRAGVLNMALDEAMLEAAEESWLRVYGWSEPSISIGFSQPVAAIPAAKRDQAVVRRWTGGGVVVHDGDWTYTLAVPTVIPLSDQRAAETYRWIHEAMIAALDRSGVTGCSLQVVSMSDGMGVCFEEPARFDVVHAGQKIAGAAQRRSKSGLLHQGTLQPLKPPAEFGIAFARELAREVKIVSQLEAEDGLLERAQRLVIEKYGATSWLEDRRPLREIRSGPAPA